MEKKEFSNGLCVVSKKGKVEFYNNEKMYGDVSKKIVKEFSEEEFKEFSKYIWNISNEVWPNIYPKEANSVSTDYYESYDKEFGTEAKLLLKKNAVEIEPYYGSEKKLYKFDRLKMKSFLFDLEKKCPGEIDPDKKSKKASKRLSGTISKVNKIQKKLLKEQNKGKNYSDTLKDLNEIMEELNLLKEEIRQEIEFEVEL